MYEFDEDDWKLNKKDWRFVIKVTIVAGVCMAIIIIWLVKFLSQ